MTIPWHIEARQMASDGKSLREISEAFGRAEKTVSNVIARRNPPKPHDPRAEWWPAAIAMRKSGASIGEIAFQVGHSESAVRKVMTKHGIILDKFPIAKPVAPKPPVVTKRSTQSPLHTIHMPREPRQPRAIINRDAMPGAFQDWLAGRISRDQMMARISTNTEERS